MSTVVSASVSVNPLVDASSIASTYSEYLAESSVLGIDYIGYKRKDSKMGHTREISKSYSTGLSTQSNITLTVLSPATADNPFVINQPIIPDTVDNYSRLEFMPIVEIKSDENPRGLIDRPDTHEGKQNAKRVLKAMNLTLESVSESILGVSNIPPMGSADWGKHSVVYTSTDAKTEYPTEGDYRTKLVKDNVDKNKQMEDVTDVSIGYFGRFSPDNTISPQALYYTYLEVLQKTTIGFTINIPDKTARRFMLHNELYKASYTLNGYIEREIVGVIEGNSKKKVGYSKVEVNLEADKALDVHKGSIVHTDYTTTNLPYFDRAPWQNEAIPFYIPMEEHYVSIKVQISPTMYKELILVDLYQETTIEGKGKTKVGNSGFQDTSQGNMTWEEAFIAESFIPLTKSSMMKVKLFDRKRLIAETKCHFIQAINITTLKWYQTSWFAALLTIISILITIYTLGAATSLVATIQALITSYAIGYSINYIIGVLVDMGIISNEIAIALVAIVAVYGVASASGITIDTSLLANVVRTIEATGKVYATELVKETKDYKDKMSEIKEEMDRLERDTGEYLVSNLASLKLSLYRILDSVDVPLMETREQFFARIRNTRPETTPVRVDSRVI